VRLSKLDRILSAERDLTTARREGTRPRRAFAAGAAFPVLGPGEPGPGGQLEGGRDGAFCGSFRSRGKAAAAGSVPVSLLVQPALAG